jgi:hypothetical protein
MSWGEAKAKAMDRSKWRDVVNALCSKRNIYGFLRIYNHFDIEVAIAHCNISFRK